MLPVLKASVHDVRYFAALLRGVNFVNRATVTVTKRGFILVAEEARTLLGTAFIFSGIFDEYETTTDDHDDDDEDSAAFEIPLNTLIECLNIFGTAGGSSYTGSSSGGGGKVTRWRRVGGDDSDGDDMPASNDGRGKGMYNFVNITFDAEPHLELPFESERIYRSVTSPAH
ncbi:repair protein Rad1/Rec1/Rad17-domain-containing protein [Mucidula mucida]|nr:repair protein Rad1/Rec1/Rad17-domain-containing protein [Mucidula mucida]